MPQRTVEYASRMSFNFNTVEGTILGGVVFDALEHADTVFLSLQLGLIHQLTVRPQVHGELVTLFLGNAERVTQVNPGHA